MTRTLAGVRDHRLSRCHGRTDVPDGVTADRGLAEMRREGLDQLPKLREDERAARAAQRALRPMIADLLDLQDMNERRRPARDFHRHLERPGELAYAALVERVLYSSQSTVRVHLGLLRQVSDDPPVNLKTPHDIRLHYSSKQHAPGGEMPNAFRIHAR